MSKKYFIHSRPAPLSSFIFQAAGSRQQFRQLDEKNLAIYSEDDNGRSVSTYNRPQPLGRGSRRLIRILAVVCLLSIFSSSFDQEDALEFLWDVDSQTAPLPAIFKPYIDLSGRGYTYEKGWPEVLAHKEVIQRWYKDIGFGGFYRIQYNLWEINEAAKDKELQEAIIANYDNLFKMITDSGGTVILDIFGTPAGMGRVLDRRNAPWNLRAFKEFIKDIIRRLSCEKKYNIWYEVWSAPDLDGFFLGRRQDYLNLYKAIANAVSELEVEYKIKIPVGGPAVSWWFQSIEGNSIITPERSLIYDLIKFCYRNRLPLDFISWHAYSTDPKTEKEATIYNKYPVALIREWLTYFHFDRNTPLVISEWNYDSGVNVVIERGQESNICASYIVSRLKNMYESGVDLQTYFSLEDFDNKEGLSRNVGIFWFDKGAKHKYKGEAKSIYNVFQMLQALGKNIFLSSLKLNDEFIGAIATKTGEDYVLLIYNYIDPQISTNYLSRNLSSLSGSERKVLLNLIKEEAITKITRWELDVGNLKANKKVKSLLKKAQELNQQANKYMVSSRQFKLNLKNTKDDYSYQRYVVDDTCGFKCFFRPVEEKEILAKDSYQETFNLSPYSVNLIVLKKKAIEVSPELSTQQNTPSENKEDTKQ